MQTRKASLRLSAVIICFAAVLVIAACAEPQPEATPTPWVDPCTTATTESITSSDPPTREYILQTKKGNAMTEHATPDRTSTEYMQQVVDKYLDPLIRNYPHYTGVGGGLFTDLDEKGNSILDEDGLPLFELDENGEPVQGITVMVSEIIDPNTLPPERRIPDCLDGVPVRFRVGWAEFGVGGESNE